MPELRFEAWAHVLFFGVLLPILVVRASRGLAKASSPLPDRRKHFRGATLELASFMAFSILVAWRTRIDLLAFDRSRLVAGLAAGAALYAVAVAYMRPRWRRAVERKARVVHLFMPSDAGERAWWLAVSFLAGIGEEITWRGVQTQLLAPLAGGYVPAACLSAVGFGLVHWIQGWRSAGLITVFGLGFQAVVWASGGSLFVAMLVHVAFDVTAGLTYGRLGRELGYAPADSVSGTAPAARR